MMTGRAKDRSGRRGVDDMRLNRAQILDESEKTRRLQIYGSGAEVDAFIAELAKVTQILELARSGVAALQRGHKILQLPT